MPQKKPGPAQSGELTDRQLDKVTGGLAANKAAGLAALTGAPADPSSDFIAGVGRVKVKVAKAAPDTPEPDTPADKDS